MIETKQEYKIGDNLNLIKSIPDKSIDLIIADPPYYKVISSDWDNQWKTFEEYLDWLEVRVIEMKRVLKDNGSLYMFGDDHKIAYVQIMMDRHLKFLNHLVWYKRNNQPIKGAYNYKSFAPVAERILFYSTQDSASHFEPIKAYMRDEYRKVMEANGFKTKDECDEYINEITGTTSAVKRHYFANSQYRFPTFELYEKLRKSGFFGRDHEDLKREYENLRRTFNYIEGMYEVFDIPMISSTETTDHPTTKPSELMRRFIKTSSNPGDTILDPFMGSGVVMNVSIELNRNYIGFELKNKWEDNYRKIIDKKKNSYQLSKIFNRKL